MDCLCTVVFYAPGGTHASNALLQHLKATPATAAIPVIVWTTRPHISDQHHQWFADHHVQIVRKPCPIEQLLSTIMDHLADDPQPTR